MKKKLLMHILVIGGLLAGCAPPQGASDDANAAIVQTYPAVLSDLRAQITQTVWTAAIAATTLVVCVRDGGDIVIPTSPVELW